jgi:hypothetical protein
LPGCGGLALNAASMSALPDIKSLKAPLGVPVHVACRLANGDPIVTSLPMLDSCVVDDWFEQPHWEHGIAEQALSSLHLASVVDYGQGLLDKGERGHAVYKRLASHPAVAGSQAGEDTVDAVSGRPESRNCSLVLIL